MLKIVVVLALVAVSSAQDITVCRSGQTTTIPVLSLSPYDELGSCRVSDSVSASPSPSSLNPDPPATSATTAPVATPVPTSASLAPITTIPTPAPTSTGTPTSATTPTSTVTPTSAATPPPMLTSAPATLPPNTIVPDNATTPAPSSLPTTMPVATTQPATTLPSYSPMAPIGQSTNAASVAAHNHDDAHEWQAVGSFSHGHMHATSKSQNRVLPSNLNPNDPKTRVLVFLQWFSSDSVYEHPQQVFMFFTKPLDVHGQRMMRIN